MLWELMLFKIYVQSRNGIKVSDLGKKTGSRYLNRTHSKRNIPAEQTTDNNIREIMLFISKLFAFLYY